MNRIRQILTISSGIVLIMCAGLAQANPAFVQAYGGGQLSFGVVKHSGKVSLTVSNGTYWHREVQDSRTPSFSAFDADGYALPDGNYVYEIQLLDEDANGVVSNKAQSGGFQISGGSITLDSANASTMSLDQSQAQ